MNNDIEIFTPVTEEEFDKLWQLNYQIFAAELKMRSIPRGERIVDKFHHKNIYRAARSLTDGTLTGMIAAHWLPPYSAAAHFGEEAVTPPAEGKLAEIRLFALLPGFRSTTLASRLAVPLLLELEEQGVTEVIISGISDRRIFYEHIGFKVTGPAVQEGETRLYPMRGKLKELLEKCSSAVSRYGNN